MQGETALSHVLRNQMFPASGLTGDANVLVMPTWMRPTLP